MKSSRTGLFQTEIHRSGNGWIWRRTLLDTLWENRSASQISVSSPLFSFGCQRGENSWEWKSSSNVVLAERLLHARSSDLIHVASRVGAGLAHLHQHELPVPNPDPPMHYLRLLLWLNREWGEREAKEWLLEAEGLLGPSRLSLVSEYLQALMNPSGKLIHGWCCSAVVLLGEADVPEIQGGPELTTGRPELDLGSVVGDVMEVEYTKYQEFSEGMAVEFVEHLIQGYSDTFRSEPISATFLRAAAAARVLQHSLDTVVYAPHHRSPRRIIPLLRAMIDCIEA